MGMRLTNLKDRQWNFVQIWAGKWDYPPPSQDPIYSSVCVGITKLISALRIHSGFFPASNDSTHKSTMKEQKSVKLLLEYILLVIIILTI